jgi:hypothetical protein
MVGAAGPGAVEGAVVGTSDVEETAPVQAIPTAVITATSVR